eukprot:jgi/Phyca11/504513/fgenesh2_kg.PHYCAscaffold_8_\
MSEVDVAAPEAPPAAPAPAQAESKPMETEEMEVDTKVADQEASKDVDKSKTDDQTPTTRKRRTSSPRVTKKPDDTGNKPAEGEDTESEPEKQPKKRAKITKGAKRGPKPGRKKKAAVEPEPDSDEEQKEAEKKVNALGEDIKSRFGQIVWAKMGGYPYWPCIITDPRLLPQKLQQTALKTLETKFLVFFFVSNNYAAIGFKSIEPWDDSKHNYREGFPEKDAKAPKRRVKLMEAIELADKEIKLPVQERADGLLKPQEKVKVAIDPAPVKRKPGRPPKAKTAVRKSQTARKSSQEAADVKEAPASTQEEEEDSAGPALSKEEIKAKVASRKTPKKKGADETVSTVGATAKKVPKATAKHGKSNGSAEIDSKRKKEIELVVPHKTVKSADIREMTEEAAKKKLSGSKSKAKIDKGDYKVGDLTSFAKKMARLQAKESARNNDELVGMMQELFKETLMYRSDVERSGLAAMIAVLRKSLSPTVGKTASALRKHMMNILNTDTDISHLGKKGNDDAAVIGTKKRKTEMANSDAKAKADAKDNAPSSPKKVSPLKNEDSKDAEVKTKEEKTSSVNKAPFSKDAVSKTDDPVEATTTTDKRSASPVKTETPDKGAGEGKEDPFEAPENLDKNRTICVDMLSKILDKDGSQRADLANEIEAALFERFKESNDDYLSQARIIIFGLKENSPMRERLFSGALHCLELAYADDAFFKTSE